MALSDRVDLTPERDFRKSASIPEGALLDLAAFATEMQFSYSLSMDVGESDPSFKPIHIYPWNVFDLEEGHFHETWFSDDPLSNYFGVDLYGDLDRPFVLGNRSERSYAKYIISMEDSLHCDSCGKLLNVFDKTHGFIGMCKTCAERESSARAFI